MGSQEELLDVLNARKDMLRDMIGLVLSVTMELITGIIVLNARLILRTNLILVLFVKKDMCSNIMRIPFLYINV